MPLQAAPEPDGATHSSRHSPRLNRTAAAQIIDGLQSYNARADPAISSAAGTIHVLSARETILRFCRKMSLSVRHPRHFLGRLFSSSAISCSFSNVGADPRRAFRGVPAESFPSRCRGRPLCLPIRIAPMAALKKGRHGGLPLRATENSPHMTALTKGRSRDLPPAPCPEHSQRGDTRGPERAPSWREE